MIQYSSTGQNNIKNNFMLYDSIHFHIIFYNIVSYDTLEVFLCEDVHYKIQLFYHSYFQLKGDSVISSTPSLF